MPSNLVSAAKTHCPSNHPYDDANTRMYQGRRYCRACKRDFDARAAEERKVALEQRGPLPKKSHCLHGHPRTPENRYADGRCKPCHDRRRRAYDAKRPRFKLPARPSDLPGCDERKRVAALRAALDARAWPLKLWWPSTKRGALQVELHAEDISTPGAPSVMRATLLAWGRHGWAVRVEMKNRGPFGRFETWALVDALAGDETGA